MAENDDQKTGKQETEFESDSSSDSRELLDQLTVLQDVSETDLSVRSYSADDVFSATADPAVSLKALTTVEYLSDKEGSVLNEELRPARYDLQETQEGSLSAEPGERRSRAQRPDEPSADNPIEIPDIQENQSGDNPIFEEVAEDDRDEGNSPDEYYGDEGDGSENTVDENPSDDDDHDHGHGNDDDGVDEDNPGQGGGGPNADDDDDQDPGDEGDHDNGHGNDDDGVDEDNPGQGGGGPNDDDDDDDDQDPGDEGDHDNGHGNDDDGVDEDNPGQGGGGPNDDDDEGLSNDGDHDRGHGNDDDGVDEDNPGQGKGGPKDAKAAKDDDADEQAPVSSGQGDHDQGKGNDNRDVGNNKVDESDHSGPDGGDGPGDPSDGDDVHGKSANNNDVENSGGEDDFENVADDAEANSDTWDQAIDLSAGSSEVDAGDESWTAQTDSNPSSGGKGKHGKANKQDDQDLDDVLGVDIHFGDDAPLDTGFDDNALKG